MNWTYEAALQQFTTSLQVNGTLLMTRVSSSADVNTSNSMSPTVSGDLTLLSKTYPGPGFSGKYNWTGVLLMSPDPFVEWGLEPSARRLLDVDGVAPDTEQQVQNSAAAGVSNQLPRVDGNAPGTHCHSSGSSSPGPTAQIGSSHNRLLLASSTQLPVKGKVTVMEISDSSTPSSTQNQDSSIIVWGDYLPGTGVNASCWGTVVCDPGSSPASKKAPARGSKSWWHGVLQIGAMFVGGAVAAALLLWLIAVLWRRKRDDEKPLRRRVDHIEKQHLLQDQQYHSSSSEGGTAETAETDPVVAADLDYNPVYATGSIEEAEQLDPQQQQDEEEQQEHGSSSDSLAGSNDHGRYRGTLESIDAGIVDLPGTPRGTFDEYPVQQHQHQQQGLEGQHGHQHHPYDAGRARRFDAAAAAAAGVQAASLRQTVSATATGKSQQSWVVPRAAGGNQAMTTAAKVVDLNSSGRDPATIAVPGSAAARTAVDAAATNSSAPGAGTSLLLRRTRNYIGQLLGGSGHDSQLGSANSAPLQRQTVDNLTVRAPAGQYSRLGRLPGGRATTGDAPVLPYRPSRSFDLELAYQEDTEVPEGQQPVFSGMSGLALRRHSTGSIIPVMGLGLPGDEPSAQPSPRQRPTQIRSSFAAWVGP
eukprot:GHUV01011747.1.p1 GENE.GHUV01011747.1~~GHUV01011747.1.p1  ORF type:complete len:643 (+),score=209.73 GHUV01011747.1:485-2413(+)